MTEVIFKYKFTEEGGQTKGREIKL